MIGDPRGIKSTKALHDGTASTILMASASGFRNKIKNFFIGWKNASTDLTIRIYESGGGTVTLMSFTPSPSGSASSGYISHDFGDDGLAASDTNSSIRLVTDGGGSVNVAFIGYQG